MKRNRKLFNDNLSKASQQNGSDLRMDPVVYDELKDKGMTGKQSQAIATALGSLEERVGKRMDMLEERVGKRMDKLEKRMDKLERHMERIETKINMLMWMFPIMMALLIATIKFL